MVKDYNKSKWKAPDTEKRLQILRVLANKDKRFNNILKELNQLAQIPNKKKWNRQTLSVYLWVMWKEEWLKHEDKRKAPYSVNKDNHDAISLLGSRTLLKERVNLTELNAQQYIRDWHTALNFAFLNIIKDYCLLGKEDAMGKPQEKILQITQEHIHDLIYIIAEYGTVMVNRIKNSQMKEEKIREAIKRLQEQIKKQF